MSTTICKYNDGRIIPAPFFSFQKQMQTTADGTRIGTVFDITINGTLVAYKGSPNSSGVFYDGVADYPEDENVPAESRLDAIARKQEALRKLFGVDGATLYFQAGDGSAPVSCNPRIKGITFEEGLWFDRCTYTINAEADVVYGLPGLEDDRFSEYVSSADESWSVQEYETPHSFTVSHTVNATGKRFYSSSGLLPSGAWEYAKQYVSSRLGYNNIYVNNSALSGTITNFSDYSAYNYVRSENLDDLGGSYSVTETWILATGTALDNYTIRNSVTTEDRIRVNSVSIDGTIQGLYVVRNDYGTAYQNALNYFNTFSPESRVDPLVTGLHYFNGSIQHDPLKGIITYSYEFDNRPYFSGTFEDYTISQKNTYEDYRAEVSIQGKIQGLLNLGETNYALKYPRAATRWSQVQPLLYSRCQQYASGVPNLKASPTAQNIDIDIIEGSVSYNFTFNNRQIDNADDEYTVSRNFSRDQGFTTFAIQGTVKGWDVSGSGILLERYNNAVANFPSDATIFERVKSYLGNTLYLPNSNPISKEITRSPNAGSINYTYQYTDEAPPSIPNAISEYLVINDTNTAKVIVEQPVLGKTDGPVLQDVQVGTSKKRQIILEYVLGSTSPTGYNYLSAYTNKPSTDFIFNQVMPTGSQVYLIDDQESFDPRRARGSRNQTYIWSY